MRVWWFVIPVLTGVLILGRCSECLKEKAKSTVRMDYCTSTLMATVGPSFDEDGRPVPARDPNVTTCTWSCSRGHTLISRSGAGR